MRVIVASLVVLAIAASCGDDRAFDDPSYYIRELRRAGLEVGPMTMAVLSPAACDVKPDSWPSQCMLITSKDSYADVLPFLRAVGPTPFAELASADGLARAVANGFEHEWAQLLERAQGAPAPPPVRIFTNHYNRFGVPGRCVTVRVAFFTVPDPGLDLERHLEDNRVPGVLFMFWKTFQLDTPKPKLIEMGVELNTDVRHTGWRQDFATISRLPALRGGWAGDGLAGAHFHGYGGGLRHGALWIDRAAGIGAPDVWSGVYRLDDRTEGAPPVIETAPFPTAWDASLRDLIERL